MPAQKPHKERVTITVDPDVQRKFSSTAELLGMSVSGIVNTMMGIYADVGEYGSSDNSIAKHLRKVLCGDSKEVEFLAHVGQIAYPKGFQAINADESDSSNTREIPRHFVDEWIGDSGKERIGIKAVYRLNDQPDLVLGRALMLRGQMDCAIVHIVVPHKTGINEGILKTIQQANLSILGIDELDAVDFGIKRPTPPSIHQ